MVEASHYYTGVVKMFKRFFIILLLSFFSFNALAEESTNIGGSGTWWINLAVGASTTLGYEPKSADDSADSGNSLMLATSVNYALYDYRFIELRAATSQHYNWNFICFSTCPREESLQGISDVGILYGLMKKTRYVTLTGSLGLAYTDVNYKKRTTIEINGIESEETNHTHVGTVGVPFEVSFFVTPLRYIGIGMMLMGNANTEASYIGGLFALQFGKLR